MTFNLFVKGLAAVWRYETIESLLPRKLNARQNIAKDLNVKLHIKLSSITFAAN